MYCQTMADNDETTKALNKLLAIAKEDGVAVASVKNGYFLVFKKEHLANLLAQVEEKGGDTACIFVQHASSLN